MAELSRLPGPVMDLWDWQFAGACREAEPSIFFHPEGERGSARRRRADAAKAVCADCPVIRECREHALRVREPYGVWGGLSEEDRLVPHGADLGTHGTDDVPTAPMRRAS